MSRSIAQWRGLVGIGAILGLALSVVYLSIRKPDYESRAILGVPPTVSGLGSMSRLAPLLSSAGLPVTASTVTPDLLSTLVTSPKVLDATTADTIPANVRLAEGSTPTTYAQVLAPDAESLDERIERSRQRLALKLGVDVASRAQLVTIGVRERSPELARWIAQSLLRHLDEALRDARMADARGRFEYLDDQLGHYSDELRSAEERLIAFEAGNRAWTSSPALTVQHLRLSRAVEVAQASYLSALGQRDVARAELNETAPQVVVYSEPTLPHEPSQLGVIAIALAALIAGAGFTAMAALLVDEGENTFVRRALQAVNRIGLSVLPGSRGRTPSENQ